MRKNKDWGEGKNMSEAVKEKAPLATKRKNKIAKRENNKNGYFCIRFAKIKIIGFLCEDSIPDHASK